MKKISDILKKSKIRDIPQKPGVYFYFDKNGKIIYVGKAKNLKNRISTYFLKNQDSPKTKILVREIAKLDFQIYPSEMEAIIAESLEIKKHYPKYNIKQKDDKSHSYLGIIKKQNGKKLDFPILEITRDPDFSENQYFGPFTSTQNLKEILRFLRKIIPYCTNKKFTKRACLGSQLNLCPGICTKQISNVEYEKNIRAITWFFSGKTQQVEKWLTKEMKRLSAQKKFEEARLFRDRIHLIQNLNKVSFSSLRNYAQDEKAVAELYSILNIKSKNFRIEAYDISNISGHFATGSMVVFENGKPAKTGYRKFRIKTVTGINDYNMLAETLKRRFGHSEWSFPGLIVLDGGAGQLRAGLKVIRLLGVQVKVVALAKKYEALYIEGQKFPIMFPKNSQSKFLLQNLRDEAHRFAKSYHTKLRNRSYFEK